MSADLDMFTAALRDVSAGPEPMTDPVVETTRRRVMSSLGQQRTTHRRRLAFAVFALALSTATLSWAASTGRLEVVLEKLHIVEQPGNRPPPAPPRVLRAVAAAPAPAPAALPDPAPASVPVAVSKPERSEGASKSRARPPRVRATSPAAAPAITPAIDADTAAYRAAHALHFHGTDHAATLAAWDAYLAAHPHGRFGAEAAYNRALTLIRLDRTSEAREALAPFAAGDIAGGYRRDDARKLREALAP